MTPSRGDGLTEMPRNSERSFCCGAGGARMWMEEKIGKRINVDRVEEAMATGAKTVAVGCPFCSTMLNDGVNGKGAGEQVEVIDVATRAAPFGQAGAAAGRQGDRADRRLSAYTRVVIDGGGLLRAAAVAVQESRRGEATSTACS